MSLQQQTPATTESVYFNGCFTSGQTFVCTLMKLYRCVKQSFHPTYVLIASLNRLIQNEKSVNNDLLSHKGTNMLKKKKQNLLRYSIPLNM